MRVKFHPAARAEMREAVLFYKKVSESVKGRFIVEMQRVQDRMKEFPLASEAVLGSVRRQLLQRFPYSILYSVEGTQILIVAVAHQSRRPGYWKDRLKDV
ncbi:MAG: type II toxin-antitoxin system RelE/ParE family toxin [Spirochaetales bacterium]|nr:type II toxin-antitoxin system RelE/ParE family toxin [Spirochaetales bacterium]